YDPVLGRMLSPDNYVQMPDFTQNFNRYSYCFNNPLVYTDPDGNWAGWDDVIVGTIGFAYGYVSHGLTTGNWGWEAVGAGALSAGVFLAGYYTAGMGSASYGSIASGFSSAGLQGYANTVGLSFAGQMVATSTISSFFPSVSIPIGNNASISISPAMSFSPSGFSGGFSAVGSFQSGDFVFSGGFGLNNIANSVFGGISYYDRPNDQYFSYYATRFGGKYKQSVGGIGFSKGDFSFRWENDFYTMSGDKYRTNAMEFMYKDFVLGTNLWTNYPGSYYDENNTDKNGRNLRGKLNKHNNGAWKNGQVWSSPLYLGYRNGNTITRIGVSNPWIQDRTQNFMHKNFLPAYTNFFNRYDQFTGGAWMYSGYYNPFTLY
ncbi:MAG: hypothetical protein JXR53_04980, partial [Bacteroidales bacterium]|nr:hypothetical protein [Bacteroidales bacterium]